MNLKITLLTVVVLLTTITAEVRTPQLAGTSGSFVRPRFLPNLTSNFQNRGPLHRVEAVDTAGLKESEWFTTVTKSLQESEYHFSQTEDGYCAVNRSNNLRFRYNEDGFRVEPGRAGSAAETPNAGNRGTFPDWKVAFKLDNKQIGNGTWHVSGNNAEYHTEAVTVQYINNTEGMRQNFIVHKPLSDSADLRINFDTETALEQRFTSSRLQFVQPESGVVLSYEQLKVWDANGKILAANFEKKADHYAIRVNTVGAEYPITIDPISKTADTFLESNVENAEMAYSAASAGDVNGDGYSDIILGAPGYRNGKIGEGAAFVYHGSATGLDPQPAVILESDRTGAYMGRSVSTAGDLNGDGYSDVVIGASSYSGGEREEGAIYVYYGSAKGIDPATLTRIEGNFEKMMMGASVACAGDVNADGFSDIIVGVPFYTNNAYAEGIVLVYHGSADGVKTSPSTALSRFRPGAMAYLGSWVAGVGDLNGDGYSDVAVVAEGAKVMEVYHGSSLGINSTAAISIKDWDIAWGARLRVVAGAGDVNGDGYGDLALSVLSDMDIRFVGSIFLFYGSPTGIALGRNSVLSVKETYGSLGWHVACGGDVNGDGYSDVIAGSRTYSNGQWNEGAVIVFAGSGDGVNTTPAAILESNRAGAEMGWSVASAGDVNGDGYSDIIGGAMPYENGQEGEGAAFVYHGGASGLNTVAASISRSGQDNANMGCSVSSAGDVNGDGYSDVIVGADHYDNGETDEGAAFIYHGSKSGFGTVAATILEGNQAYAYMGGSVAFAGDVNGDGYGDVIIGAVGYDNGAGAEGAAWLFYGSPAGIDKTTGVRLGNGQALSKMGISVAGAGDVNGDGYSDVIIGATDYTAGETREGAAFIYHGSKKGINNTWATIIEGDQPGAGMGHAVSNAGDVNGDGLADVIIGAIGYTAGETEEGAVFIHYGSKAGVINTAAAVIEGNQARAGMGYAVGTAGDVNGDGYSDVIAGAIRYMDGEVDEGAAFVYHGGPTGLNTTPAATLQANQANARMGFAVSNAGDVNNDGYSDVVVGSSGYENGEADEGAAFVYHGSANGINASPGAILEMNQAGAEIANAVSYAGDVNGDGFSDVMLGARLYNNGADNRGAAFLYSGGNAGLVSTRGNLCLYNIDLATPVNSSNFSEDNFGIGLFAKSFMGRGRGKLVWETKASNEPYNGMANARSSAYAGEQEGFTDLTLAGVELKSVVNKLPGRYTQIRARVQYDPTTAITGQLYGPWRYVSTALEGTAGGVLPVDLVSFDAAWKREGFIAEIRFVTENESEICCYEIEKSNNGLHFSVIGRLDAKNVSERTSYYFMDDQATAQKQYYRLKILHDNGDKTYSRISLLQDNTVAKALIYPNPTAEVLELKLGQVHGQMEIQILTGSGRVLKRYNPAPVSDGSIKINVGDLLPGSYLLYLKTGAEKQALPFLKE